MDKGWCKLLIMHCYENFICDVWAADKIERQAKRIKELEKQNDDRLKLWNKQHHITDAQIDAARSYINRGSPHEEILLEVFAELDISWCEGCGSREVKDE